jgi:hypothetical protein
MRDKQTMVAMNQASLGFDSAPDQFMGCWQNERKTGKAREALM